MKNCDEMVNSLLERREQYVAEQKRKKKVLTRTVISICCMCLVILLGFGMWQKGNQSKQQTGDNENLFVVNQVDSITSADMDVQFSYYNDLSALELETVHKNFESAIGMSYETFTAKIPVTFVSRSFHSVDVPADATKTEYITHDYVFEYQTKNNGEATIAICSVDEPLRDCFYECDNPEQSEINGVAVIIYGCRDSFMMRFSYKNVNYDIETVNITREELKDLLTGIMR